MKELKLECTCGKLFSSPGKALEHYEENGLIEVYYQCPHCGEKHHVCYMNREIKNVQKLIDKARNRKDKQAIEILVKRKRYLMDALNGRL